MLTAKRRRTGIDRESFQKGDSELSKAGQERLDRLIERKYMSTKTITKRVALATVVALGAGVLSLVSVTSAHAQINVAPGTSASNPAAALFVALADVTETRERTPAPSATTVASAMRFVTVFVDMYFLSISRSSLS